MKDEVLALALLVGALTPPSVAAGPLVDLLKSRQARVDAVLENSPGELPAADRGKLEEALTGALDFGEMARAALGTEWEKRSPSEQSEFAAAFEALLRASLLRRVGIYRVDGVEYGEEAVDGAAGSVRSTVRLKEATTEVAYSFRNADGAWRIVDYSVDGVSTVRNYRSQFTKILARSGFGALLARIRRRTAQIQGDR